MNIILDYKVGNTKSLINCFNRLGIKLKVSSVLEDIENAELVILPGVGAFKDAISSLRETGLDQAILRRVKDQKPILGICLGMQLLFEKSFEDGETLGLGILKGEIDRISPVDPLLKVPHMGWNTLISNRNHIISNGLDNAFVYYVHSYFLKDYADDILVMTSEYGETIPAVIAKGSLVGVQFHPEKSGQVGEQLLENILTYFRKEADII